MVTELEKIIGEGKGDPKKPSDEEKAKAEAEAKAKAEAESKNKTPEELKKEQQKANLDIAISQASDTLRKIRKDIKKAKQGDDGASSEDDEEVIPKIDDTDPSAKAWNKRIVDNVAPVRAEIDKEKEEIFTFTLREFLSKRPILAGNLDKVKELVSVYERLKDNSGRTKEGVLLDLGKAYGATHHEQLEAAATRRRMDEANADSAFGDIAVDTGAAGYHQEPKAGRKPLSAEDKAWVTKWYGSEEAYYAALEGEHKP